MSTAVYHRNTGPSFTDLTQDVWQWGVRDIVAYIRRQCEAAETDLRINPTQRNAYVTQVYWDIIIPALDKKAPFVPGPDQQIKHVYVSENTGPVICVTDFYTAFGYVVTMTELGAHSQREESFHAQLVVRFARLCYIMHQHYFKPNARPAGNDTQAPAKAYIIWGPMGSQSQLALGFEDDHSFSLSTSLPRAGRAIHGFKAQAQELRKDNLIEKLLGGVNLPRSQHVPQEYGHCAETLPFTSRLSPNGAELKGLAVEIEKVGRLTSYDPHAASNNRLYAPACPNCRTICNHVGHPVHDLANGQRYGQPSASSHTRGHGTSRGSSSVAEYSRSDGVVYGQDSRRVHGYGQPSASGPSSGYQYRQ